MTPNTHRSYDPAKTVWFHINVCPCYRVHSCDDKRAEESRGLFGFHDSTKCPKCYVELTGFEFWGENGHQQGGMMLERPAPIDADQVDRATRLQLAARLRAQASKISRMTTRPGFMMRTKISTGAPQYYAA